MIGVITTTVAGMETTASSTNKWRIPSIAIPSRLVPTHDPGLLRRHCDGAERGGIGLL
jgi:hypothetical protein